MLTEEDQDHSLRTMRAALPHMCEFLPDPVKKESSIVADSNSIVVDTDDVASTRSYLPIITTTIEMIADVLKDLLCEAIPSPLLQVKLPMKYNYSNYKSQQFYKKQETLLGFVITTEKERKLRELIMNTINTFLADVIEGRMSKSGNNASDDYDNALPPSAPQQESSDEGLIDRIATKSIAQDANIISVITQREEAQPNEENQTGMDLIVKAAFGSYSELGVASHIESEAVVSHQEETQEMIETIAKVSEVSVQRDKHVIGTPEIPAVVSEATEQTQEVIQAPDEHFSIANSQMNSTIGTLQDQLSKLQRV
ncbi:hypothetical protein AKJ16_DCAP12746, partial [Drosera capensis]